MATQYQSSGNVDPKAKAAETKKRFQDVWPKLEDELVNLMKQHSMPEDATEWFRRVRLWFSSSLTFHRWRNSIDSFFFRPTVSDDT